jgi:site-specific DNA-methyltransferase (adenine-specific)
MLGPYRLGYDPADDNAGIYTGDAIELLKVLPDESIDLVVTSPPYDDLRTYGGHSWDFFSIAKQLIRVIKPGGVIVWVVADQTKNGSESGNSFKQALYFKTQGLNLWDTMIYHTDKSPMNDRRYQACFEYMFVFSKGKPKTFNPLKRPARYSGKKVSNQFNRNTDGTMKPKTGSAVVIADEVIKESIWYIPSGNQKSTKDKIAFQHPATFPEKLARDHIHSWSNPGDIVLDPFMGSGTTGKAAYQQGRRYLGFEIHAEYSEIARKRLHQTQAPLFTVESPPEEKPENSQTSFDF